MQLLIILALLLYGGKSGAQNLLAEVKPVLESIGGDEMRDVLKSAEEISNVLSAVTELTGANGIFFNAAAAATANTPNAQNSATNANSTENESAAVFAQNSGANTAASPIAFPLKPISNIADRKITYSLSRYINQN